MEKGMFIDLFNSVNRLFTQPEILFKKVPSEIEKVLFLTYDLDMSFNNYDMITFTAFDTPVCIIREKLDEEEENAVLNDICLINSVPTIISIIPDDIMYDDFDKAERIKIIDDLYRYLCDYYETKIGLKDTNTILNKLIIKASMILTIHTLAKYDLDFLDQKIIDSFYVNAYVLDGKEWVVDLNYKGSLDIRKILDSSVYTLLDCNEVLGLKEIKE